MLLATAGCGTPTTPTDAGPESSTDVATSGDALLTNDVTTTADAAADVIAPTDVPVAIDARQDAAASDSQAPTDVPVASDVAQACALTTGAIWEDSGGHVAVHYS